MSVNKSILNKTFNRFTAVGTVNEMGMLEQQSDGKWKQVPLQIVKTTREKWADGKPTGERFSINRLRGTITLKTQFGIQEFSINFSDKKSDGKDDKRWTMAKKIMDWVPAINPPEDKKDEKPTLVTMSGSVRIYDNVGKDGKMYSNLQWNAGAKCQHTDNENTGCTLTATGYVKSVRPETKIVDDSVEETGRLLVTLYAADNHGQCFPIECIVDEELADVFMDNIEVGNTIDCDFDRIKRHIGGDNKKKRAFGRKGSIDTTSGFDVEELILTGADVIEEPEVNDDSDEIKTKYIYPEAMEAAIKEREKMLEELLKNGDNKKSSGTTTHNSALKAKKDANKKTGKFGTTHKVEESDDFDDDDEEMPF